MDVIEAGWDSRAFVIDGRWLDREPRRPAVAARLMAETTLLPWLAPQLPLQVPVPHVAVRAPLRVRHRLVPGHGTPRPTIRQAVGLAEFLLELHGVDVDEAIDHGVPDPDVSRDEAASTHRLRGVDRSDRLERRTHRRSCDRSGMAAVRLRSLRGRERRLPR